MSNISLVELFMEKKTQITDIIHLKKNSNFLMNDNIMISVITWPSLKKNGQIWVCPESDYVCTRFFFM